MPVPVKKKDTAERILDSAEFLFARQGYSGTTTREIAAMSGISIQTLHHHFGSKQELFNQVLARSVIPVTVMINEHIQKMMELDLNDENVLQEATNKLIDELFEVLHRNPNYPLLFFRQWLEQDPELRRVEWEQLVPYLRKWVSQVESKVSEKRRRGIDLHLTFVSLSLLYWGLFTNHNFLSAFLDLDPRSKKYKERIKAHAKEATSRLLAEIPQK